MKNVIGSVFSKAVKLVFCGLFGLIFTSSAVLAQIVQPIFPSNRTSDAANVDLTSTLPFWKVEDLSIGHGQMMLDHAVMSNKASMLNRIDSWSGNVDTASAWPSCYRLYAGSPYRFIFGGIGQCFYLKDGIFTSYQPNGATLEASTGGELRFTDSQGSVYKLSQACTFLCYNYSLYSIVKPSGLQIDVVSQLSPDGSKRRVRTVMNSAGYRLYYKYVSDNPSDPLWKQISSVVAYNAAYASCDPAADCVLDAGWPSASYSDVEAGGLTKTTVTDAASRTTVFTVNNLVQPNYGRFSRVKTPESSVDNIEYTFCPNHPDCSQLVYRPPPEYPQIVVVQDFTVSASVNGAIYNYGLLAAIPYTIRRNSISPEGLLTEVSTNDRGDWQYINTPEGNFRYSGDEYSVLSGYSSPAGDGTGFGRDARGNLTQITHYPRSGSTEAPVTESATYPVECTNRITCNLQTSHTDARGNTTTFEYDPVHGGMLSKTGPAVNGVSPQTRYSYIQKSAYYLDASGSLIAGSPVWLIASERFCRTSAATSTGCSLAGDEVVRYYEYAPPGVPDNLQVRGVVDIADGVTQRTCYTYDRYGNKISETSPSAALQSCT